MNAILQARNAYRQQSSAVRTPRRIEHDVFARVTHALRAAARMGAPGSPELVRALHDNRRLWTTIAADLMSDGNALPADLRARLISLAEFTRRHSGLVLRGTASPDPLIEVNAAVMKGLAAQDGRE